MNATVPHCAHRIALAEAGDYTLPRSLAVEAPVALEYNGIGYAVMMATPVELKDFARGFTLSEGLVANIDAIGEIDVHETQPGGANGGWVVRIALLHDAMEPALERARKRVSESGCGQRGMENIEQVLRPLPPVAARCRPLRRASP